METFLLLGGVVIVGWAFSLIMVTLISIVLYPFDKKIYTHPRWYTIFPYYFKIQHKVKQSNGQNLVYTHTPTLLEFPFLGDNESTITREIYTKEYLESDEYKKLRKSIDKIFKEKNNGKN
jgi:hypothetical protein